MKNKIIYCFEANLYVIKAKLIVHFEAFSVIFGLSITTEYVGSLLYIETFL